MSAKFIFKNLFDFLFISFIFLSPLTEVFSEDFTKTLCVDVGGTRIKAALLHPAITLEELKTPEIIILPSEGWLNQRLPQLFYKNVAHSLVQYIKEPYHQISFGITGPVVEASLYVAPKRHIPFHLKEVCEKIAGCPVYIENDSIIWARGVIHWHHLIQEKMDYPCLGITLGTGIGAVLIKSPDEIICLEISVLNTPFYRLHEISKQQPSRYEYNRKSPHDPIGNPFFSWMQERHLSHDISEVRLIFNQRILAFVKDMQQYLSMSLEIPIQSVVIGGGNSRFISKDALQEALNLPLFMMSPESISQYGVSPDIISLLGCLMTASCPAAKMIPSWEESRVFYIDKVD